MKKLLIFIILIIFTLTGCNFPGTKKEPAPKPGTDQTKKEEPRVEKKDYYIGLETPVEGVRDWVYRYRQYEGVFLQKNVITAWCLSAWGKSSVRVTK